MDESLPTLADSDQPPAVGRANIVEPWTAALVAARVLGDPDANPASDLALRRRTGLDPRSLDAGRGVPPLAQIRHIRHVGRLHHRERIR